MQMDAFICQVLIIIIVNWFHLDFNSVKSYVYSATYKKNKKNKIKIRYLKFDHVMCFCHYMFLLRRTDVSFLKVLDEMRML